jgi:hypothetical protein
MTPLALCLALIAQDAQAELTQGIVAFGRGDLTAARKHLDGAEAQTTDPALLSRIHRQRGIIDQVEGHRLASVLSFMRALYFDPKVELSEREHKGEVQQLFSCARELEQAGLSEKAVEVRHARDFAAAEWKCPTAEKPQIAPPPPLHPPAHEESSSIWSSPWLWVAVGAVVVAGGATTAGILLTREDPYGGTSGINLRLER